MLALVALCACGPGTSPQPAPSTTSPGPPSSSAGTPSPTPSASTPSASSTAASPTTSGTPSPTRSSIPAATPAGATGFAARLLSLVHQHRRTEVLALVDSQHPADVYRSLAFDDENYGRGTPTGARCGLRVCVVTTTYPTFFDDYPMLAVRPGAHGWRLLGAVSSHLTPWGRYTGSGTGWACTVRTTGDGQRTWVTVPRGSLVRAGVDLHGDHDYVILNARLVLWDRVVETLVPRADLRMVPTSVVSERAAKAWCAARY